MKKVTFFLFAMIAFCWQSQAQFTFPTQGPLNTVSGVPIEEISLNNAGNTAGVTSGQYDSFTITLDWTAGGGNPWSNEAEAFVTTSAGTVNIDPPTSGSASSGTATTLTYSGALAGIYDPDVNGAITIGFDQSYAGSDADLTNIVVTLNAVIPPTSVDCAAGTPVNTTYCYGSSDTTSFTYQSTDGSNLRVTFNAGGIEACCDEVVILDSDGTTELYRGANGGDLSGLIFSSTGDTITIAVDSDSSVDCASSSSCCAATWDWDVECLSCTAAVVDTITVIEDCGNNLFDVEVTFSSLGDAAFVVGTSSPFPFAAVTPGVFTYTLSGYAKGTNADITVNHLSPVCDFNLPTQTDACPLENDECANAIAATVNPFGSTAATTAFDTTLATASPEGAGSCEGFASGELDLWYEFTTNSTSGINIEVIVGTVGNLELAIYDACGGTEVACISGLSSGLNSIYGLTPSTTYQLQVWTETFNVGAFEIVLSDIECLPSTLDTTTIVDDCGNDQFSVTVELSDVADATAVSDGTNTYPFVGTTATAGPFATGSIATLEVIHGATTSCNYSLGTFEYDECPIEVDCSGAGVAGGFCYDSNDLFNIAYNNSDGTSALSIVFTAGTLEESSFSGDTYDDLIIYDGTDNTGTVLYNSNDGIIGNNDLTGLSLLAPSGSLYLTFDADGSNSCATSDQTAIAYDVTCVSCAPSVLGTTSIVENCGSNEFSVQVDLATVGDATGVFDGTTTYPLVGSTATAGPYTSGVTTPALTVIHSLAACDYSIGTFDFECPTQVDCASGTPLNQLYCYGSNDTTAFTYQSSDSSTLRVTFNAGGIEACCDEVVILDSDGVTELYRGANGGDLAGLVFISSGDTITVAVDSDSSVDCQSSSTCCAAMWDWDVECLACTAGVVDTTTIVGDCGSSQFSIDVDLTTVNDATGVSDGTTTYSFVGSTATAGPYADGATVNLTLIHTDSSCDTSLGNFSYVCPPANDECVNAIALTVNADQNCDVVTSGTVEGATASGENDSDCSGTENDDVWYTFVATSSAHRISLINIAGSTTDMYHSLWEGSCGALTNISCNDGNTTNATGLTPGNTYTVKVNTWTSTPGQNSTFDICIGTPPSPPANDECADAIALTVNPDFNCGTVTSATIESATASGESETACSGTENDDVWFTFVATQTEHTIDLINVTNGTTDLYHSLWEGSCGSLTNLLCSDPNSSTATGLTPGNTYTLRVNSWTSTAGQTTTFDVCIGSTPPPPANDTCATAIAASVGAFGSCATTSFDNTSASHSGVIGSCEGFMGADEPDVWFSVATDAVSTSLNIEVTAGTPGLVEVALYDACGGTEVGCISGLSAGLNTISGLSVSTTYFLQVWTETGSTGAYDICLSYPPLCTPADITSSTVVDDCGSGTFTVDVLVADSGSAGSVIDDGTSTYPVVDGTVTTGPYTVGDIVTLNVVALDSNCDIALGTFSSACPPLNDDFANAIPIACGDTIFGDTSAATLDENDAPDGPGSADTDSPNIWYSFLGTGQTVDLDTCLDGTDYDTEIMVYTGTSGNLTWVAEGYDECDGTNSDFLAQASFLAEAGIQYWISVEGWNVGNTGTFEMTVTCTGDESFVYYDGSWIPSDPTGTTVPGDIVVANGNAVMTGNTDCNTFTVRPGGGTTIPSGASVTTTAGFIMESSSVTYSSLILDGTLNGSVSYDRHVNINGSGDTGSNDLVSAPLTGQSFSSLATANPNIFNNGTLYLFGPYDKTTGQFVTWAGTESSTLNAGIGYRAATSDNGGVTFTGTPENGPVSTPVVNGGPIQQQWNLVGNPYPSYMDSFNFVQTNLSTFDPTTAGIWGYDGSAINGWTLVNLANAALHPLVAPGQGFFVSAAASGNIQFDPSWRSVGTSDDYIVGRNAELVYMKLKLSSGSNAYGTDFFFNSNASLGFDLGYDAEYYGDTLPAFSLYSSLVENNTGNKLTLQTLNSIDVNDVTIPLGVNAVAGEELRFSIAESTLPPNVQVFLDDTVANTTTLLNDSDYVLTPSTDLSGTGRFYLRTSEDALSTIENSLDLLDIYTLNASDKLVVSGQLLDNNTMLNLYDIAGRLVLTTKLDSNLLQNRIDVSSINSGVYIVTVHNDSQEKTKKVIID